MQKGALEIWTGLGVEQSSEFRGPSRTDPEIPGGGVISQHRAEYYSCIYDSNTVYFTDPVKPVLFYKKLCH